jgi:hypothetical protein
MLHLDEWRRTGGILANLLLPELWTTCARCARLIYVLPSPLDGSLTETKLHRPQLPSFRPQRKPPQNAGLEFAAGLCCFQGVHVR